MTDHDNDRPRRPLAAPTLRAIAASRGFDADEEFFEALTPLVADLLDLANGIQLWIERQPPKSSGIATSSGSHG